MSKHKHFTFLYVPSKNTGLKTVKIPKWSVGIAAIGVLGMLVIGGIAIYRVATGARTATESSRLARENEALRSELVQIDTQIASLKHHVTKNFDFQKKARILANLDDLSEDETEVGVGGPNTGYIELLEGIDTDTQGDILVLREDLDKLVRQAKLQSDSYTDVIDRLSGQQKRLNATPSICPVARGYLSSRFGPRMDPITGRSSRHYGVDYSARLGTPVLATADGIVTFSGKWANFGWTVELSHGFDFVTRYAHCSKLLVKKGQRVKRGDVIARVGASGRSTATHLHYEVIAKGKKKNPLAFVLSGKEVYE